MKLIKYFKILLFSSQFQMIFSTKSIPTTTPSISISTSTTTISPQPTLPFTIGQESILIDFNKNESILDNSSNNHFHQDKFLCQSFCQEEQISKIIDYDSKFFGRKFWANYFSLEEFRFAKEDEEEKEDKEKNEEEENEESPLNSIQKLKKRLLQRGHFMCFENFDSYDFDENSPQNNNNEINQYKNLLTLESLDRPYQFVSWYNLAGNLPELCQDSKWKYDDCDELKNFSSLAFDFCKYFEFLGGEEEENLENSRRSAAATTIRRKNSIKERQKYSNKFLDIPAANSQTIIQGDNQVNELKNKKKRELMALTEKSVTEMAVLKDGERPFFSTRKVPITAGPIELLPKTNVPEVSEIAEVHNLRNPVRNFRFKRPIYRPMYRRRNFRRNVALVKRQQKQQQQQNHQNIQLSKPEIETFNTKIKILEDKLTLQRIRSDDRIKKLKEMFDKRLEKIQNLNRKLRGKLKLQGKDLGNCLEVCG